MNQFGNISPKIKPFRINTFQMELTIFRRKKCKDKRGWKAHGSLCSRIPVGFRPKCYGTGLPATFLLELRSLPKKSKNRVSLWRWVSNVVFKEMCVCSFPNCKCKPTLTLVNNKENHRGDFIYVLFLFTSTV